jgi:histidinol phosphatase-like enzyme (inositol monophosphatase family)
MAAISDTLAGELAPRLALALAAAKEAGKLTLRYFQQDNFEVERKSDASPVTIADRSAEQLLRERIAAQFPRDGILGEEFGAADGTSGFRWILDPIDGTKSFISGVPLYGTMVGVEHEGRVLAGVVFMPGLDEGVYASTGPERWQQQAGGPRLAHVSSLPSPAGGLFTSQIDTFAQRGAAAAFETLRKPPPSLAPGATATATCSLPPAELMVDPIHEHLDAAAVQPIIEEAGGVFTDWQGLPTIHSGEAIASNSLLHSQALAITRQFPKPQ